MGATGPHILFVMLTLAIEPAITSGLISSAPPAGAVQPAQVAASGSGTASCPCSRESLCQPVTGRHTREVFGFSVSRDTPYERCAVQQQAI